MTRDELIETLREIVDGPRTTDSDEDDKLCAAFVRHAEMPGALRQLLRTALDDWSWSVDREELAPLMLAALDPAVLEAERPTVRWPATEPEPGAMFPNLLPPAALYLTVSDLLRDPFVRRALEHRDDGIDAIQSIVQEVARGDSVARRWVDKTKAEFDNLDPKFRIRQRVAELERELAEAKAQL